MFHKGRFDDIQGIRAIFADDPMWPNPANIFLIPHGEGFSMFDVGCGGPSGISHIVQGLNHWKLDIKKLDTVVLSHAHPDHMGAIGWLLGEVRPKILIHYLDLAAAMEPRRLIETFDIQLAERYWASSGKSNSPIRFDLLSHFEQVGCSMEAAPYVEKLTEGQLIHMGEFTFEVIHTPGHSPGHISLFERERGLLLSGDVVGEIPAWYTPTSGGMIGYLDSLNKLETLQAKLILPSHGRPMAEPREAVQAIQERLLQRKAILLEALRDGPKDFWELNEALFQGPQARFFPGCGITESHLLKLEKEGVIQREGVSWRVLEKFIERR